MDFSSAHPDERIWQTPSADTPINTIPQPPGVSPKIFPTVFIQDFAFLNLPLQYKYAC